MTGAGFTTLTAPTTTVATVAPDDPNALEYALTWTGLAATTTAKFQAFGTSDNALTVYHLSQRTDVE
jgi:cytochrome oxidase assembly protein ShyY1